MFHFKRVAPTAVKKNSSLARFTTKSSRTGFTSTSEMIPTGAAGVNQSNQRTELDLKPLLDGFVYTREDKQMVSMYHDIYAFDALAGSTVDLMSAMPFSSFDLTGFQTTAQRDIFMESIARLNISSLLPELSTDYLVTGTFVGSLLFDQARNIFVDIIPQPYKNLEIQHLPFYGFDPIITATYPKEVVSTMSQSHPRIKQIIELYGKTIVEKIKSGKHELDPISTIYLPRQTSTTTEGGTSYYRRILPIYFLEKNLYRGTLMESIKRQRSILHITAGVPGEWEPTEEDLSYITDMFMNADADPLGAIIATREGISPSEVRCLSGNTIIHTENGLIKLGQVVDHDPSKMVEGTKVAVDLRVRGYEKGYSPVKYWWYNGYKPVYNMLLKDGTLLNPTENHKWMTIGAGFKIEMVRTRDILGHYVLKRTDVELLDTESPEVLGNPIHTITYALDYRFVKHAEHNGVVGDWFINDDDESVFVEGNWEHLFQIPVFSYEEHAQGKYAQHLELIKKISPKMHSRLLKLISHRYNFVEVVGLELKGYEHVYDLTMDKSVPALFLANGVMSSNSGGDFWKITDIWDSTSAMKLKALGINEGFLSGDSSYAVVDSAMTTFMESLQDYRNKLTTKVFYEKLFPLISLVRDYYKDDLGKKKSEEIRETLHDNDPVSLLRKVQDSSVLMIPKISWTKNLRPAGDDILLGHLDKMKESGVPVPLRMLAAAGGLNIEDLLNSREEDVKTHKEIAAWTSEIQALMPQQEPQFGASASATSDDWTDKFRSLMTIYNQLSDSAKESLLKGNPYKSDVHNNVGRPNLLDRDYGVASEVHTLDANGKPHWVHNQKEYQDRVNDKIIKSVREHAANG